MHCTRGAAIGNFRNRTDLARTPSTCQFRISVFRSFLPWPSSPCSRMGIADLLAAASKFVFTGCRLGSTINCSRQFYRSIAHPQTMHGKHRTPRFRLRHGIPERGPVTVQAPQLDVAHERLDSNTSRVHDIANKHHPLICTRRCQATCKIRRQQDWPPLVHDRLLGQTLLLQQVHVPTSRTSTCTSPAAALGCGSSRICSQAFDLSDLHNRNHHIRYFVLQRNLANERKLCHGMINMYASQLHFVDKAHHGCGSEQP